MFGMRMATRRVSFTNEDSVHSVEVTADTLFEAVAFAIAEFRDDKTTVSQPPLPPELRCVMLAAVLRYRFRERQRSEEPVPYPTTRYWFISFQTPMNRPDQRGSLLGFQGSDREVRCVQMHYLPLRPRSTKNKAAASARRIRP
jgi:hypothetical protein